MCRLGSHLVARHARAVAGALAAAAVAATGHGQAIDALSDASVPRNDRLVITGSGFGPDQGDGFVTIGGLVAPVSFWSEDRIHAYVPVAAALGPTDVQVFATAPSNALPLVVETRETTGERVRWRFRADDSMLRSQPAVGPDGSVYFTGLYGHLYALAPDGALRWIVRAFGNSGPSVAEDGTIFVGGGGTVKALTPDGAELWTFSGSGTLFGGPNLGPDGNVYGATGGYTGTETGAFVLSPEGELLFSYPGLNFRNAPAAWEVAFGPNGKWYVTSGMGYPSVGIIGLLGFDVDGGFEWLRGGLGQVRASAAGNVYVNNPLDDAITSYDVNGDIRWSVSLNDLPGGSPAPPALGPDETFYVPTSAAWRLNAIGADGVLRWSIDPHHTAAWPVVRGDDAMVVTGGYAPVYAELHVVQAFAPATGEMLWSVELPFADATYRVAQQWYGEFSADGSTIYVPTSGTEAGYPFAYLYAINTTIDPGAIPGDVTGDGLVDFADVLALLAAWGPCDDPCSADLDGDLDVDFQDLLQLLANWSG